MPPSRNSVNEGLPLELCGEFVEEVIDVAPFHAGGSRDVSR
jgi:hypothetical protein